MAKLQKMCGRCMRWFRPKGSERLCFRCIKTKPKKLCTGWCNKEFRPKTAGQRVCETCQKFSAKTARQYATLEKPDFTLEKYRELTKWIVCSTAFCTYCRAELAVKTFSLDHQVPRDRGGDDLTNNIDPFCCHDCNTMKGSLTGEEFTGMWSWVWSLPPEQRGRFLAALKTGAKMRTSFMRKAT